MQGGETQKWTRLNGKTCRAMFPKRGSARMSVYSELWHYYWNWHVSMEIAAPYMVRVSRSQERGCWQLIIKGDWLVRALHWGEKNGRLRLAKPPSLHWLEPWFLATYGWGSDKHNLHWARPTLLFTWDLISMGRLLSQKEEETLDRIEKKKEKKTKNKLPYMWNKLTWELKWLLPNASKLGRERERVRERKRESEREREEWGEWQHENS